MSTVFTDKAKSLTDADLLDEVLGLAGGDNYDGCFTSAGEKEFSALTKELKRRFLGEDYIIAMESINQLKTKIGKHGYLANLVCNIRNRYISDPTGTFSADEVRMLVEGFMTEVESLRNVERKSKV